MTLTSCKKEDSNSNNNNGGGGGGKTTVLSAGQAIVKAKISGVLILLIMNRYRQEV